MIIRKELERIKERIRIREKYKYLANCPDYWKEQTLTQLRDPLSSLASRDFTRISRDKTTMKEGDSHGRYRRSCRMGD